jgi:hypothetical protein
MVLGEPAHDQQGLELVVLGKTAHMLVLLKVLCMGQGIKLVRPRCIENLLAFRVALPDSVLCRDSFRRLQLTRRQSSLGATTGWPLQL